MGQFTDFFLQNQYQLPSVIRQSQAWFQQQAGLLARQRIQPLALIKADAQLNTTRVIPGELYLFAYDPKYRDTLPYWDRYPLVFPFKRLSDGFIGLNMHYLPYRSRILLLDRLQVYRNNSRMNETTRLKMSWGVIEGVSRIKSLAEPCVHRYLDSHLMTPLKKINAQDWATAMMLPVERFVGSTKNKVWTESLR